MTLTFSFQDNFEFSELNNSASSSSGAEQVSSSEILALHPSTEKSDEIRVIAEKLDVPHFNKYIERPRLTEHLKNSVEQFGATLITGRAGTGKTALAADFTRQYEYVAWYRVESSDTDWRTFSQYFVSAICKSGFTEDFSGDICTEKLEKNQEDIARFISGVINHLCENVDGKPILIVIDDVHYLFDNDWFSDFFHLLVHSLLPNTHLLLLSRSQPEFPLWRLRSKQVLGVVDEKLLAFNLDETEKLYNSHKLPPEKAKKAHRDSFGRISKLMSLVKNSVSLCN